MLHSKQVSKPKVTKVIAPSFASIRVHRNWLQCPEIATGGHPPHTLIMIFIPNLTNFVILTFLPNLILIL